MNLFNLLAEDQKTDSTGTFIFLGVVAVLFIGMMIFSSRQRKKQMAEDQKKKDSLCKGTKVITIGGIVGTVVSVDHEESTFVLATGNCEMVFDKRAIYQMTLPEDAEKEEVKKEVVEEAPADKKVE
ncbi:MAG: preprotein translocase subunit YajC, partial [Clostridia bacterium]|nr:preprotein translocase subunit YajC [Clostridia bacterium]